jgi:hypothetical protein
MDFDINTIKESFKSNQFCLDFYRNIYPFVVLQELPDDVNGDRIIFGKRNGIEIIRHDAGKADASFQFRCTYDEMVKLENMGHTRIEIPGKSRLFPVVTVVVKEEAITPIEKIGRDMKNYYKANALLLLKFEGTRRERENFDRDLSNYGIDVVFGNELTEVNVHVRDEKLLSYSV